MRVGQFSASVSVGGVELAEYAPEYSADGMEATCWIPSEEGKQFCVKWTNDDASKDREITGRTFVDGMTCGGTRMQIQYGQPQFSSALRDSVAVSPTTRRPLLFAKQVLTDDDAYLNNTVSLEQGTIKIALLQVRDLPRRGRHTATYAIPTPRVLHEQSKKAMGHSVQLGVEYDSANRHWLRPPGTVVKQLVTFVFKYRPIGLLRAQGIAPPEVREERAVSPMDVLDLTMVDDESDEDVDDVAEIKKLRARLSALENKNKKRVKADPSEVKREIKNEERIFQPGEVIDLT
ncbi:hypothetical protein C8R43DRAFT_997112 [Mycena crocata]|nr:hypothetical protein C8R43DRAFT_997112 [Mycena crocata]